MIQFKIKAFDIEYSITAEDLFIPDGLTYEEEEVWIEKTIKQIRAELPKQLELEIECEEEDLEDELVDAISEETGWLIEGCNYDVIERKNSSKDIYKLI